MHGERVDGKPEPRFKRIRWVRLSIASRNGDQDRFFHVEVGLDRNRPFDVFQDRELVAAASYLRLRERVLSDQKAEDSSNRALEVRAETHADEC